MPCAGHRFTCGGKCARCHSGGAVKLGQQLLPTLPTLLKAPFYTSLSVSSRAVCCLHTAAALDAATQATATAHGMDEEESAAAHQLLQLQDAAAVTIQRCWRGHAVRTAVIEALTAQLRAQQQEEQEEQLQQQQQQQQDADDALQHHHHQQQQQQHRPALRVHMMPQQAQVQEWSAFAARQAARYVRAPPSAGRRLLPQPVCYRLRILHVGGVPQPPQCSSSSSSSSQGAASQCYELQLGVSLFDESLGLFYGSTVLSPPEPRPTAAGDASAVVTFDFDVFFHSDIADPRCMAVVELILVQREADGSSGAACSAGWAQLPLCLRKPRPVPAGLAGSQLLGRQAPSTAPVMSGTPRYLQFRSVCGEQLPPPAVLGDCTVTYQADAYPAMDPVAALLPQDFLVTQADVIPGLRRFDLAGNLSTALKGCLNTLASPLMAPAYVADLAGVRVVVPQTLHQLLAVLPQLLGMLPPADLTSLLSVQPCDPQAVSYAVRLRLHNSRTFVGPWVTADLQAQANLGSLVLQPTREGAQALQLDWLLVDRLMVLVLELLATPAASSQADGAAAPAAVLVGRAVLAPFEGIEPDGNTAALAARHHHLAFDSCSSLSSIARSSSCWAAPDACATHVLHAGGAGSSSSSSSSSSSGGPLLPLNWRALLGDTATRRVPDASMEFELQAADREPHLWPVAHCGEQQACVGPAARSKSPAVGSDMQPAAAARSPGGCAVLAAPAVEVTQQQQQQQQQHGAASLAAAAQPPDAPWQPESPAVRSLRVAAQHLEQAASIPVAAAPPHQLAAAGSLDGAAQLQQLTVSMQQQLDMLAAAVSELKQERHTLRSSLTLLQSAAAAAAPAAPAVAEPWQQQGQAQPAWNSRPGSPAAVGGCGSSNQQQAGSVIVEADWPKGLPSTSGGPGQLAGFSGQPPTEQQQQQQQQQQPAAGSPNRAVLQQLHEAGMSEALPPEVRVLLQSQALGCLQPGPHTHQQQQPSSSSQTAAAKHALLLAVEARDPRTACDVVLQLLAFRPAVSSSSSSTASGRPAASVQPPPSSMHFTLNFYDRGPTHTQTCALVPSSSTSTPGGQQHSSAAAGPETLILQPAAQHAGQACGAGLVLKFSIDGSAGAALAPGQDPGQAAYDEHIAFSSYLATRSLWIDVWDGKSLLQMGTCAAQLRGLLRQGRELREVMLEMPVLQHADSGASTAKAAASDSSGQQQGQQVVVGWLVLRVLNLGREPSNTIACADTATAALGPRTPGNKVVVRAALFEPGSPVARELRGSSGPLAVDWQQQQQGAGSRGASAGGAGSSAAAGAADIISFEQRKVAREQRLKQLLQSSPGASPVNETGHPGSPLSRRPQALAGAGPDGASSSSDPFQALQRQLLSDVDAVRTRQKPGFIRSQLRQGLVTQCVIRPSPGQALLLQHTLTNCLGRDAVFELRTQHPQQLVAVESLQELRELELAAGPAQQTSGNATAAASDAGGGGGQRASAPPQLAQLVQSAASGAGRELASHGRIFIAANERVSIPLCFRLQQQEQQLVVLEFVPLGTDHPVAVLELDVRPRQAVIDRTLRYHCPERELLHAELPLSGLSGVSQALLAAAAAGRLTVAASRPDVSVSVLAAASGQQQQQQDESACIAAGEPGQQRLCVRHKCGAAPATVQFSVWLYGDAAMAKPLETWQVFIHTLQRVDMRAAVGQSSSTSLAIAAGGSSGSRLVTCYSSQPGELAVAPALLELPAGGVAALALTLRPSMPGHQWVRVHLVDAATRSLVHSLLVSAEAHLPPVHRRLEVTVGARSLSHHDLQMANPTNRHACFTVTSNTPWLLSVQPPGPRELPPGARVVVALVVDASQLAPGSSESGLVFIKDARGSLHHDECVLVRVCAVA